MSFAELLSDLGAEIELELAPDDNGTCLLEFEGKTQVQLEPADDDLVMGMTVGYVPPGKGRDTLFEAALIANGTHLPGTGIFAFSAKTDQLILFEMMPMRGLTGRVLAASLELFLEKGTRWQEAIQRGTTPQP